MALNHYNNQVNSSGGFNVIEDASWRPNIAYTKSVSTGYFYDSVSAPISYTAAGMPAWILFDTTNKWFKQSGSRVSTLFAGIVYSNITVGASTTNGSYDSLNVKFKIGTLNTDGASLFPPVYPDATVGYSVSADASNDTHLSPDVPLTATDAENDLVGYRIIQPAGITLPFNINSSGYLYVSDSTKLVAGTIYKTVIEAYDNTPVTGGLSDHCSVTITINTTTAITHGSPIITMALMGETQ